MRYIPQLINRTLLYYALCGLTGRLPPKEWNIVSDPRLSVMGTQLFRESSHRSLANLHCEKHFCTIHRRCGMTYFIPDEEEKESQRRLIYDRCLFTSEGGSAKPIHSCIFEYERMRQAEGLPVVVFTATDDFSREAMILTRQTYDMAASLPTENDKYFFLYEYLSLPEQERRPFARLLQSPGAAECFFVLVCHLAGFENYPAEEAERIAAFYEKDALFFPGISWMDPQDVHTLLTLTWLTPDFSNMLSLWAVLHGISAWEDGTKIQKLCRFTGTDKLRAMLAMLCSVEELEVLRRMALTDTEAFLASPHTLGLLFREIQAAIQEKGGKD